MTRETLDKLRSMGMNLGSQYDVLADALTKSRKNDADNAQILNIQVKPDPQNKQENNPYFIVRVVLSTSDYTNLVFVEVDGRIIQASQKSDIFDRNSFYAQVYVDLTGVQRLEETFTLTATLKNSLTNQITDTKSVYVKVNKDGNVGVTDKKVDDNKVDSKPVEMITLEQLVAIGVSKSKANEYIDALNKTFQDYKINTNLKIIHFLAQAIHESGGFRLTTESGATDADYGGFKGRGLLQLTGKINYTEYEEYEGEDFTSSLSEKEKLEVVPYSVRSAGWFWCLKAKLNNISEKNDFIFITKSVNGGFNHYDNRLEFLKNGFKVFNLNFQEFNFEKSLAYNDEKASFGWGLWQDPDIKKVGFKKNKENAITGYKRFLELAGEDCQHTNWYRILEINEFKDLKFKKGKKSFIKVIDVVKLRLKKLENS